MIRLSAQRHIADISPGSSEGATNTKAAADKKARVRKPVVKAVADTTADIATPAPVPYGLQTADSVVITHDVLPASSSDTLTEQTSTNAADTHAAADSGTSFQDVVDDDLPAADVAHKATQPSIPSAFDDAKRSVWSPRKLAAMATESVVKHSKVSFIPLLGKQRARRVYKKDVVAKPEVVIPDPVIPEGLSHRDRILSYIKQIGIDTATIDRITTAAEAPFGLHFERVRVSFWLF